jgi:hypothetical protein
VDHGVPKGVVFDFVEILKDKFGFNYTVKFPKENILGDANTGIISMLHKKVSGSAQGPNTFLGYVSLSRLVVY